MQFSKVDLAGIFFPFHPTVQQKGNIQGKDSLKYISAPELQLELVYAQHFIYRTVYLMDFISHWI